jgi:hypothetical protein
MAITIMVSMDGTAFSDVGLKKADQVKTLARSSHKVKVDDKHIVVDSHILFNRLLVVVERS